MTLSPAIRELCSLHEIFRRLGFLTDHLYVDIYSQAPVRVQFAVRFNGRTTLPVFVVDIWEDCSDVQANYQSAVEWWNNPANAAEVLKVFESSYARRDQIGLVTALATKGLLVGGAAKERA